MDLKDFMTKNFFKKLGLVLYEEVVYKAALAYVRKTDNTADDSFLQMLDAFVKDLLKIEEKPEA